MDTRRVGRSMLFLFSVFTVLSLISSLISASQAQKPDAAYTPVIPKTWDEQALADLEVPLADPSNSPKDISADDYYRIPVRPIYRSYPKILRR